MSRATLGLTLALFKPDLYARQYAAKEVYGLIMREGFYIVHRNVFRMGMNRATLLYEEHRSKFFYTRLVSYISSGQTEALVLAHPRAIQRWRELMGPTKPTLAQTLAPNSIRSRHGLTDTRNSVHGSGCEASFQREMAILLPDFNIDGWYQHQEPLYRMGSVQFSEQSNTHILITPTPCLMQQQKQQEFAF